MPTEVEFWYPEESSKRPAFKRVLKSGENLPVEDFSSGTKRNLVIRAVAKEAGAMIFDPGTREVLRAVGINGSGEMNITDAAGQTTIVKIEHNTPKDHTRERPGQTVVIPENVCLYDLLVSGKDNVDEFVNQHRAEVAWADGETRREGRLSVGCAVRNCTNVMEIRVYQEAGSLEAGLATGFIIDNCTKTSTVE